MVLPPIYVINKEVKIMEIIGKYIVNLYDGKMFLGNATLDSYEDCLLFALNDSFATRATILHIESGIKATIKLEK